MIVVDTNVIACLLMPGDRTPHARRALRRDAAWAAPLLWRSEFRNVLAVALHRGHLSLRDALEVMETAITVLAGGEYEVPSAAVLGLAAASACSAYDCEFVALARDLAVTLVTSDERILRDFPDTAVPLEKYGSA